MRIPSSTIVMAVLVCIPFGMAIRDTLDHPSPTSQATDEDEPDEADDARAQLDLAQTREAARVAALEAHAQEAQKAALPDLLGAEPATLGPGFGDVHLGEPDETVRSNATTRFDRDAATTGYGVRLLGADQLRQVTISPRDPDGDACATLQGWLAETWGNGDYDADLGVTRWINAGQGQRASLAEGSSCVLTIEQFVSIERYLAKAPDSTIPLGALGGPVRTLQASLPGAIVADGALSWSAPGVAAGTGLTNLMARVVDGKVTSIAAYTAVAPETQRALVARLTSLFGPPEEHDDRLTWTRRPPITLDLSNRETLAIFVGSPQQ